MKLLHLTDLHLNPVYHKKNIEKTERILQEAVNEGFDHLVITGDVTHDADEDSFVIFRELLKRYDLLDTNRATITIGNHDIFGGVYSVKDLLNYPERCKITNYSNMVANFVKYYEELFIDCYFPSNEIFPFCKIVDNTAFIGLNTNDVYSVVKNPFASNGKVSADEYDNLVKIFNYPELTNKQIIIVAHHHFYKNSFEAKSSSNEIWNKIEGYTLKLRGKKKLIKLFKKHNVKLILHGHSHENKEYSRMGIPIFNGGGSIDNDDKNTAVKCLIDIDENNVKINEEKLLLEKTSIV